MRKSILMLAALAMVFVACGKKEKEPAKQLDPATFEDIYMYQEESVYHLDATGTFESGDYIFTQEVSESDWGTYYYGNVVTNKKDSIYRGDWDNDKSASGGAFDGENFLVWTASYFDEDGIQLKEAATVPGMYVNNTPWVVDAIRNGDQMSDDPAPFTAGDFFDLTIEGIYNDSVVKTVLFHLAQGSVYVKDWTYVDLTPLGKVTNIRFKLSSSKKNAYGMTTPAYFAIDNFGAKADYRSADEEGEEEKEGKEGEGEE